MVLRLGTNSSRWIRTAASALVVAIGVLGTPAPASAEPHADPFIDRLAEGARTPALHWADCAEGFQCSSAQVPLDYNQPGGEQIELAVIKLPASDPERRIGTLFVNFGGPGPSGVDRLRERGRWPWLFSEELRARFDVVSWDPRGVGQSAPVNCFANEDEQVGFLGSMPELPTSAGDEAEFFAWSKDFADRCRQHAGPILDHTSTADTARDLDLLRRAVGDEKLTYHGISYGTQVGAIYANMFPSRVRAMAFDGSMDFEGNVNGHGTQGATVPLDARQNVAAGIAATFDAFLRQCSEAGPRCAFSAGDPKLTWIALAERARLAPIRLDGQAWTYASVVGAAASLSQSSNYPDLAVLLQRLFEAGTTVPGLLPVARDRSYSGNRTEAYHAIQCSDSAVPTDPGVYSGAAVAEDQRVPYFGRVAVFSSATCAFWQGRDADRYTGPWNRRTAAPILVLNTRYDPATPMAGAYAGAAQLADAQVVVIEGAGHSSMYVPSSCAEQVKRDYLFTGQLPPKNTGCSIDKSPFD
ncbi:alpha/beta hydrolase [Nocardia cyriacigeorgica]|uniref:Alpha/beta hydrolase n=1 Tax=Nocardia cyriacigeorgica TaxID=135487 RepID=A0ABX0CR57_9NOCA|nr:alpha/beta hydrolase [Nocardia cyriacigeorgica]NEW58975.1 alpha/beta hydrolase [Nocardia cyriacigeorgica]